MALPGSQAVVAKREENRGRSGIFDLDFIISVVSSILSSPLGSRSTAPEEGRKSGSDEDCVPPLGFRAARTA